MSNRLFTKILFGDPPLQPAEAQLAALKVGDHVQIRDNDEIFWTKVHTLSEDGIVVAEIGNNLHKSKPYNCGDLVQFDKDRIGLIETAEEFDELAELLRLLIAFHDNNVHVAKQMYDALTYNNDKTAVRAMVESLRAK